MSARSASSIAPGATPTKGLPGFFFLGQWRKLLIVAVFIVVLGRVVLLNVGVNLQKAGVRDFASELTKPVPSLDALLLRQQWSLFTDISPFNATGWKSILFYSEPKIQNNLYGSPDGQRRYLDYLIRKNRIDPSRIDEGVIFIRYRNLLKRGEAAAAGTHYGPEIRYDLFRF